MRSGMSSTVLLVRHARAGDKDHWEGDDMARPLDREGAHQAKLLVDMLGGFGVTDVLSSPALRCRQTVEPLAQEAGTAVVADDRLREERAGDAFELAAELGRRDGCSAVLCTHGDVIPAVLRRIRADHHLELPQVLRCAKGGTWVLRSERGRFLSADYLEAPSAAG